MPVTTHGAMCFETAPGTDLLLQNQVRPCTSKSDTSFSDQYHHQPLQFYSSTDHLMFIPHFPSPKPYPKIFHEAPPLSLSLINHSKLALRHTSFPFSLPNNKVRVRETRVVTGVKHPTPQKCNLYVFGPLHKTYPVQTDCFVEHWFVVQRNLNFMHASH